MSNATSFRLKERVGDDPESRDCRVYPDSTTNPATILRWLQRLRMGYTANGCIVRCSVDILRPGFVAEKDGRFYAAVEIVEVDHA